ncbi:hypothetical protein G9X18_20890 [Salmonella enterica subsp. enterica serovar Adjame]|nr:hypothetical protein G9X18_20890 [Salmonella enterica subsp. enterica serovar Adjame]
MYLALGFTITFPIFAPNWLRSEDSKALNPIIFAFLRNPLKFAALVAPDNGNDHSQERDKLISL